MLKNQDLNGIKTINPNTGRLLYLKKNESKYKNNRELIDLLKKNNVTLKKFVHGNYE